MSSVLIGKPAPAFSANSTFGEISLERCLGRGVIIYFYPKDNTPGCTTETQDFRDLHDEFLAIGCVVIGVSRDSLKSHENFSKKLELPFPLIADTEETVCQAYDVMKLKQMYGKQVRGIERSTFLIDARGKLVQAWRGVKVPGHAQEVLQAARSLT
ncbi:peroxiredoxin [Zwartia vadi]|uniref:peroxiredoxin n=1 Tax=Zwartia vadi TaxID=3058168 RepID=UPI0025B58B44|nr:peroxiredoxin [Zwartia vadi]MDN3988624.1 peroxiredoxin [Zwartia vadi]